jgi:pyruvate/oxaloacetate carboxyltransferase
MELLTGGENMKTYLEKLIDEQVTRSVLGAFSRTTDKVAEDMAREILQDREFRARVETLIKQAFEKTLTQLQRDAE